MTLWKLARRAQAMNPSVIREILRVAETPGIINLAGGLPSPKTFPIAELAAACARILRDDADAALQYGASSGYGPLREALAERLPWNVDPSHVLILTGSQQGLDLVAKLFIDPGSRVLVERPTYLGALQAFSIQEPKFVEVAGDDEGVLPEEILRQVLETPGQAERPRFIYLLPTFQNPTGRTLSERRRADISRVAAKLDLPIVEDNAYGDLWFEQAPPLPLAARNPEGCIYLGSLSKVMAPGLRLGFLIAPKCVFPKLLQAKQAVDLHTPTLTQRMVLTVLADKFLNRHVAMIRALYQSQRDAMIAAIRREMKGLDVTFSTPTGGMFLWLRMPDGVDAATLLSRAVERNVAFVPGIPFYAGPGDSRTLRLSFVTASVEEIGTAIAALALSVREVLKNGAAAAYSGPARAGT